MKWLKMSLIVAFFIFLFSFTFTSSSEFDQDLGRHLTLGKIAVQTGHIPSTNLFSYTNPDFPFINHHWLSEVIFYLFSISFGNNSLIILKTVCVLLTIAILFFVSSKLNRIGTTTFAAFLFTPLLLDRLNIRPEIFGYIFFAFLLLILLLYPKYKKLIYLIPVVMVLWINMHITFIFGVLLNGLILFNIYWREHKLKVEVPKNSDFYVVFSGLIILLVNPHFIKGALYPLFIFGNYGYSIVENQNLFFLLNVTHNPYIKYFFVLSPLVLLSFCFLLIKRNYLLAVLLLIFSLATIYQIRHMPFFVFVAIIAITPLIDELLSYLLKIVKINHFPLLISTGLILVVLSSSYLFFSNIFFKTFDVHREFGLGFHINDEGAARFILDHNLPSPIFNNFDVGGYAIYRLYPKYKMFVDNRPEAYPADFMQQVYIGLQNDPAIQDSVFKKYNIQTIYFSHTDQTPWGNVFVTRILNDKNWKLVYFDKTMMVLTKGTGLTDVRNNQQYFIDQINNENDAYNLLLETQALGNLQASTLANLSLSKAARLNPYSCLIKKYKYSQLVNSPLFYQAEELKHNSWWCF